MSDYSILITALYECIGASTTDLKKVQFNLVSKIKQNQPKNIFGQFFKLFNYLLFAHLLL